MSEATSPSSDESAESIGDLEDLCLARERWAALEAGASKTLSLDEMEAQLGVDR